MKKNRAISPHLTIYKPQITSLISIFHRISGSFLSMFILFLVLVIQFDILFSEYFLHYALICMCSIYFTWLFKSVFILIFGLLFFHICNGLRHLSWDFGFGLDIKNVYITGLVVLTIACAILILLSL
jgi:succinate dehydrogenase / fumarate reductase cytochrome b subunit